MDAIRDRLRKLHLGTVVGVLVAVYIGVYLVQTVQKNYELQKEIDGLQEDITDLRIEQDQLKYKIQYYQTEAFKEKEAREKLGLQQPGESVLILPQDKTQGQDEEQQKAPAPKRSNFEQWLSFLMGRS